MQNKLEQEQAHSQLRQQYEKNLSANLLRFKQLKPVEIRRSWSNETEEAYAKFRQFGAGAERHAQTLTQLLSSLRKLTTRFGEGDEVFDLPQRLKRRLEQIEGQLELSNSCGVRSGQTQVDADSELDYCIEVGTRQATLSGLAKEKPSLLLLFSGT